MHGNLPHTGECCEVRDDQILLFSIIEFHEIYKYWTHLLGDLEGARLKFTNYFLRFVVVHYRLEIIREHYQSHLSIYGIEHYHLPFRDVF